MTQPTWSEAGIGARSFWAPALPPRGWAVKCVSGGQCQLSWDNCVPMSFQPLSFLLPAWVLWALSGHMAARTSVPQKGPGSLRGRHLPTSWPKRLGALCCPYHLIPPFTFMLITEQKIKLCQEIRGGGQDCHPFLTIFTFGSIQKVTSLGFLMEFPQKWSENQSLT